MALLAYDGFDHYNAVSVDMLARNGFLQWTQVGSGTGGSVSLQSPGAQGTGSYLHFVNAPSGGAFLLGSLASNLATFYVGTRIRLNSGLGQAIEVRDLTGGAVQVKVHFDTSTASLSIQNASGTVLAASANNVYAVGTWVYVEVGGLIDPAAGSLTVKINGVQVLTFSGNTRTGTSNSYMNGLKYAGDAANATTCDIDDVYVNDGTTGPNPTYPCNTFLGDVRVFTGFARANSAVAWTPLANLNYQEVNEHAMDSDTSYNLSATPGQLDLFNFDTIDTAITSIIAVGLVGAYKKDNSGTRTLAQQISSQGTIFAGSTHALSTSYAYYQDFVTLDPATGAAWTYTHANAIAGGYSLVA